MVNLSRREVRQLEPQFVDQMCLLLRLLLAREGAVVDLDAVPNQ
jgi:hypothetical protein